jgi:hypothetical protein
MTGSRPPHGISWRTRAKAHDFRGGFDLDLVNATKCILNCKARIPSNLSNSTFATQIAHNHSFSTSMPAPSNLLT